jgi:uroporphyrinogen-III decarboxylase
MTKRQSLLAALRREPVEAMPFVFIDAIDWLTPPPTGDVVFAQAQQVFGGRICILGALAPAVLRFGTSSAVEAHLHEVLAGVDVLRGFVLVVPSPIGTPMANVARIRQVLAAGGTGLGAAGSAGPAPAAPGHGPRGGTTDADTAVLR